MSESGRSSWFPGYRSSQYQERRSGGPDFSLVNDISELMLALIVYPVPDGFRLFGVAAATSARTASPSTIVTPFRGLVNDDGIQVDLADGANRNMVPAMKSGSRDCRKRGYPRGRRSVVPALEDGPASEAAQQRRYLGLGPGEPELRSRRPGGRSAPPLRRSPRRRPDPVPSSGRPSSPRPSRSHLLEEGPFNFRVADYPSGGRYDSFVGRRQFGLIGSPRVPRRPHLPYEKGSAPELSRPVDSQECERPAAASSIPVTNLPSGTGNPRARSQALTSYSHHTGAVRVLGGSADTGPPPGSARFREPPAWRQPRCTGTRP